jgi:Bacterial Ig-like domain (group 3)/FG-GAP-like repeat/FG-GAP repeat
MRSFITANRPGAHFLFQGTLGRVLVAASILALPCALAAQTSTTLAVAPGASVNDGTAVTLTATVVSSSLPVYPGTVLFCDATASRCDGAALYAAAQLTSSGIASFKFFPGAGIYTIKAVYAGLGSNSAGSSASASQTLTVHPSVLYGSGSTLVAAGLPGDYTLTGIVAGFGIVPPAGQVTFLNQTASTTLGIASLAPLPLGREFNQAFGLPMSSASWEATGDFNGDGIPDLAVVNNSYSGTVSVLLGNGDGTFNQNPASYAVGHIPQFVTVADLNHDGFLDIVVANTFSNDVEVLLGIGNGTFAAGVTYATGANPGFIAVGDLNGDGILDLAVANTNDSTISVLLGNGNGSFRAQTTYAAGTASGVAIGDFNHDGIPDLAVTNLDLTVPTAQAQSTISLFLGVGDGTFPVTPRTLPLPVGLLPSAPVAADLRRNGALDLLFADTESASAYVMLGNNDGTFAAIATYATEAPSLSVAVGDINHDGILDLVVADTGFDSAGKYLSVLLGVGDGTFGPRADYGIPNVQGPQVAVLADFNGDGLLDISTADASSSDASVFVQLQTTTATLTGVSVPGPSANYAIASYAGDANHLASNSRQASLLPLPSTMVLAGSPDPSPARAVVTLTASLTGASGTPTGVISFYSGTTLLGTGTLNNAGVASYILSSGLTARTSFSATYPGDHVYAGSRAAMLEYVGTGSTIALSVSSASVTAGTPVTLTSTVTPDPVSTPPAAGQVVFNYQQTVNGVIRTGILGTVSLNSLGVGRWKFVPSAGAYSITATFNGTSVYTPSTSVAQALTVAAGPIFGSVTALTATTVAANDYTLLGSVTAFGQSPPSGLVSFLSDTATVLGSVPLDITTLSHSLVQAAGSPLATAVGENPTFVTIGDLNGDGIPDLVTGLSGDSNYVAAQFGMGNGTFATATQLILSHPATSIAIADLNGDGIPDIIASEASGLGIFLGTGGGAFAAESFVTAGTGSASCVVAADLNGDGILDLAVGFTGGPVILMGVGDGTFRSPVAYAAGAAGSEGLAVADFNHDGIPDMVEANQGAGSLSVFLGVGDGTFATHTTIYIAATNPLLITAADLRHIGTQDVVVTNQTTADVYVLLGNNDGTFQHPVLYATGATNSTGATQVLAGDLNNDGVLDLAVADFGSSGDGALLSLLPGMGDGTFGPRTDYPAGLGTESVALGDLNGDGLLDLATANRSGSNTIYLQRQSETASLANVSLDGAGNHNVLASYAGDASRTASQSAVTVLTGLNQTTTTTALSYASNPAYVGQTITFTAIVAPIPAGTPLGTVAFYNGTTLIGSSAVNVQGVATCLLANAVVGSSTAHAVYSGNPNYASSTSGGVPFTVAAATKQTTTATVTSSNLTPTYGQSVTLMATITPASTDTPPGTIKFYSGTTLLGTQAVSAQGLASLNISLPLGPNAITAVYSGSASFAASTSGILSISNRAVTATSFSASPTIQLATMAVVFTAQVNSATTGVQTGTVSFLNGSTVLATVTLTAGQAAVYSETSLSSGTYSVTASYSGDGSFLPSASTGAPVSITVSDLNLALGGDNNKSVVPGGAVTYNFPLSPVVTSTFIYDVTLTATGLPPGATYTFSPATIPAGSGTLPVAFTVQTAKSTAMLQRAPGSLRSPWLALVFALLLPLAGAKRFRARLTKLPRMLLFLVFCGISLSLASGLGGCGTGGFLGSPKGQTSYTIIISATSGTLVRTGTVQLNLE